MIKENTIAFILLNSKYVPSNFRNKVNEFLKSNFLSSPIVLSDDSSSINYTNAVEKNNYNDSEKIFNFSNSIKTTLNKCLLIDDNIIFLAIINLDELYQCKRWYEFLNIDFSLPDEYLYFSFDDNCDFGYSSRLIWGKKELVLELLDFDDFVAQSLNNTNNYVTKLTKEGWPISRKESILKKANKFLVSSIIEFNTDRVFVLKKHIERVKFKLKRYLIRNHASIELFGNRFADKNLCTYDNELRFEIKPILKYFILHKKLRNSIRFLSGSDFYILNNPLIQKVNIKIDNE